VTAEVKRLDAKAPPKNPLDDAGHKFAALIVHISGRGKIKYAS
jgi:hypothetical protein